MLVVYLTVCLTGVSAVGGAYTKVGDGPCRGNAGANDKVNSRTLTGVSSEAACEAHCDAVPSDESDGICAGFAYEATGSMECILYGPGMAGQCNSPNSAMTSPTTCMAVGTCTAPAAATSEDACGTCSDSSAVEKNACTSIKGTWTAGTWTTTGVWDEAAADGAAWTVEFMHTDHVHAVAPNANYVCYDKDVTDHVGKCSGAATCATDFAAADTFEKDSCPDGCTWSAAPSSPSVKQPHPATDSIGGYKAVSGACRGTSSINAAKDPPVLNQDRPNYAYKKNADFPSFPTGTSPKDLAAACDKIDGCVGFHSGPWMSLFGPGINETDPVPTNVPEGYIGAAGQGGILGTTTLNFTKPNPQYICFIKQESKYDPTVIIAIIAGAVVAAAVLIAVVVYCKQKSDAAKKEPKLSTNFTGA